MVVGLLVGVEIVCSPTAVSHEKLLFLIHIEAWYAAGETGPIPWTIYNAQNVLVENINQVQSPFWHNFVYQSSNVTFNNINLHSIQTDGSQAQNTGKIVI
jgi:polygalacturonase